MMYTGGISLDNLESLVKYDLEGIFCGSAITKKIDHPEVMKTEAEKWLAIIKKHKN